MYGRPFFALNMALPCFRAKRPTIREFAGVSAVSSETSEGILGIVGQFVVPDAPVVPGLPLDVPPAPPFPLTNVLPVKLTVVDTLNTA